MYVIYSLLFLSLWRTLTLGVLQRQTPLKLDSNLTCSFAFSFLSCTALLSSLAVPFFLSSICVNCHMGYHWEQGGITATYSAVTMWAEWQMLSDHSPAD